MDIELGNDTDLAYVVKTPAGHVYSIYKNGMATGFPEGSISINKAALYDLVLHAEMMRLTAALRKIAEKAKAAERLDVEAWAQELHEAGKIALAALAAAEAA